MTEKTNVMDKKVKDLVNDVKNVALIVGGIALGCAAVYCVVKVNGMESMLKVSIKDAAKNTDVTVSDAIVRAATDKAVSKAVKSAADAVVENARIDISASVKSTVSDTVNNMYGTIKDAVAKEIADKVSRMDISDLRREVKDLAKTTIMERLEADMDDMLSDYNRQLESVGSIYKTIADTMKEKL